MKKTVLSAAFALTMFAGSVFGQDAISGTWTASAPTQNGPMDIAFTLKAGAAGAVTGTMGMAAMGMEMPISDGKLAGKDLTFKVTMTPPPGAPGPAGGMTMSFAGKLDGDTLTLTPVLDPAMMPPGSPAPTPLVAKRAAAAPAKNPAAAAPAKK